MHELNALTAVVVPIVIEQTQLVAAAGMLESGAEIVRLNSRKYQVGRR